jgi:hypothetical protein
MKERLQWISALALASIVLANPSLGIAQQDPPRPRSPTALDTPMSQTLTGKVARFTRAPTGEIDGFELDSGAIVHYPPFLSDEITSLVAIDHQVRVTGVGGGGPGTGANAVNVLEARTITNVTTNRTVDLQKLMEAPSTSTPSPARRPRETSPARSPVDR